MIVHCHGSAVVKGIIGIYLRYSKEDGRAFKETQEYIQEMVVVLEAEAQSDIMYMKVRLESCIT